MASIARSARRSGSVVVLGLVVLTGAGVVQADSRSKEGGQGKDCDREKQVVVVNGPDEAVPVRVVGHEVSVPFQRQIGRAHV